ncbi:kinase modulator [Lithospermum erythrorhizon]|uniref:Kinase modulator n=1 Tax=Lithospermum erythrorhizon TaxID=34254 RepID=A0AAV3PZT4_LITER
MFHDFVPAVPLPGNFPPSVNHMGQVAPVDEIDNPSEPGMPALITWSHGGNNVLVEGSWDNWKSRKKMQRSGKDHSILLILPSGVYHYKFVVDGEVKYIPELPHDADDKGHVCNLLDVNDYVPENPASVAEFEAPPSPDSSYGQTFMGEDDFAKEPMAAPPHVHLTVHGMENSNGAPLSSSFTKPQHTILNHLFIDKGWASRSTIALGATQRFRSKYVSTVLYKPLKR